MTCIRSSTIHRLLLLTLCSLAPLGARAGADPVPAGSTVTADASSETRAQLAVDLPASDDLTRGFFFAPSRSYPLRTAGALWHDLADGLTLLFDSGENSDYNYALQYDYQRDLVVNVVRYHNNDHATILASLGRLAAQTRSILDHTEHGSRLRIKTPRPDPPPIGCYWLEFVAQVKTLTVHFQ